VTPQIDHLCWLVDDPVATEQRLRDLGIGSERGMYYARAGTQHWMVPLLPPQGLEFMTIVNREDAATGDVGAEVLAAEAQGGGLFAWAVLVDDLEVTAERHGLDIDDYTLAQPDGTLRGWRTVSGPPHLPFFIDYPNNGNRHERLVALYERVGHTVKPTSFTQLTIEGDEGEMRDWLGPHDLPLTFVRGQRGLVRCELQTAAGRLSVPDLALVPESVRGLR
jgi:hypothetical protein